jgi:hypothetical protein
MLFNDAFNYWDFIVSYWAWGAGGMIRQGEMENARSKACSCTSSSITNPTRTGLVSNTGILSERFLIAKAPPVKLL